jgi:hypothetical protein
MSFLSTWGIPLVICCLVLAWFVLHIRKESRQEDREAWLGQENKDLKQRVRILELRCDAMSKAIDPKAPQGAEFTCPQCGSHHWSGGDDGYLCHGYLEGGRIHCMFSWDAVDNHLFFKDVPKVDHPTPEPVPPA